MDTELGAEQDLPADPIHFLTERTAPDQKGIPSPTVWPHIPTKSPQHNFALAEGPQPKAPIAALSHQSWEERDQTLSAVPTDGFLRNCPNPTTLTPIGGRKRQQPLGCHLHHKRPLAGRMLHWPYKGFACRTHPATSGPQNFWVICQEKTLALAWVLQACAEASRV